MLMHRNPPRAYARYMFFAGQVQCANITYPAVLKTLVLSMQIVGSAGQPLIFPPFFPISKKGGTNLAIIKKNIITIKSIKVTLSV